MKTKEDAKTTATSANLTKSSKPKRRGKRPLIICGILVVVAVVVVTVTSPENIMRSYLRSKYGKDFVLVGELRRTPLGRPLYGNITMNRMLIR